MKLNKVDEQVIATLKVKDAVAGRTGRADKSFPSKKVFRSLKKLFENEMIDWQRATSTGYSRTSRRLRARTKKKPQKKNKIIRLPFFKNPALQVYTF